MIAVQGPNAIALAKQLIIDDPSKLGYYFSFDSKTMNVPSLISRTGYTGEDGIEIILPKGEEIKVRFVAESVRTDYGVPGSPTWEEVDMNTIDVETGLSFSTRILPNGNIVPFVTSVDVVCCGYRVHCG